LTAYNDLKGAFKQQITPAACKPLSWCKNQSQSCLGKVIPQCSDSCPESVFCFCPTGHNIQPRSLWPLKHSV